MALLDTECGIKRRPERVSGPGPKFKLLHEGDIQVCRLQHSKTLISKVLSSKFLRRWEAHHIFMGSFQMYSATPSGFMEFAVPYHDIQDVHIVARWDSGQHFCMRISIPEGSVLLRSSSAYVRDQWLHSLKWKIILLKYKKLVSKVQDTEILIKELKELILASLSTPIQDDSVFNIPMETVSQILALHSHELSKITKEMIIFALAPTLEYVQPSPEICSFFNKHCKQGQNLNDDLLEVFTPAVQRILKHNMHCDILRGILPVRGLDFGKYPHLRLFVQDFIYSLYNKNGGSVEAVKSFVKIMHSPATICPHPRVLPNMVAVVLAAVYSSSDNNNFRIFSQEKTLDCFMTVLEAMSEYEDWQPNLAILLQPIPFPKDSLKGEQFIRYIRQIVKRFSEDERCEVHQAIFPVREGKDGWVDLFSPGGVSCDDEGEFFAQMLRKVVICCGRKRRFLIGLKKNMLGPFMLMALRGDEIFIDVLASMLDLEVIDDEETRLQVISTLESTAPGKKTYERLCEKKIKFREMQRKGGPTILTLPTKSTDDDLAKLLGSGSFGNLQSLNLAFTHITSACAEYLIQLPELIHLNLWSTQFGDTGLQMLAENLEKLQTLNLCETPVTDAGLASLVLMSNLRSLNLNSTKLSSITFERLKSKLPYLQEIDIRYTDV